MRAAPYRLASGGRIDRASPVGFWLDGTRMQGFRGDTLASALLGSGITLAGRSFKYHRPRGFLCAGVDEPNGLFTLGEGERREPNIPGTLVELTEGLRARRQNGWPSVEWDLMALNSLVAPVLAAGFYYKTFMGPTRGSWMLYEPFIRRAAGLGRAGYERDPDRYETRHDFTDVLVVGGGPAGLAAALTAGRAGARVVLAEQDWMLGGSLLREPAGGPADLWCREVESELQSLANVEIHRRTTAQGVYDGRMVTLVQRRDHLHPDALRGEARQVVTTLRTRAVVFATGAFEQPLIFSNNDRPGVMLASAARTYLNRFAVAPGKRAIVATNNDSAYRTAFDLAAHGVHVVVADQRRAVDSALESNAKALAIELHTSASIVAVLGRRSVKGVVLQSDVTRGRPRRHDCDAVCLSGGWSPAVHLTSHGGIKPRYRDDIGAFVPGGYAAGHFGAGALTGAFRCDGAVREGIDAGRRAAAYCRRESAAPDIAPPRVAERDYCVEAARPAGRRPRPSAFVDFQNDVTEKDVALAHEEGYRSVEHLKRYTTLGMGTDQGKTSNLNALTLMASLDGVDAAAAGTTTFRPPFSPMTLGALAGRNVGPRFRPVRRSPLHAWHVSHGGEMIESGLWLRPWYYRWAGPTAQVAHVEEMRKVRAAVGICDVSTLGKIDVQGPDAAAFLDRIYVNDISGVRIGKARYGVMLSDGGTVLDDGTVTRLGEARYFVTTTTGQASEVLSWLERLLQTAWPDLRVQVTSVTDEWAAMVVAGPDARAALSLALPGEDFSASALPHMGCFETAADGVPLRVIRLSFSGELAFEIYVPAGFGVAMWSRILAAAEPLGIRPYGLEALAALRLEKGYVAGLELDHRTTLDDLGLGRMAREDKAYVGRAMRRRPGLQTSRRWSLVGVESLEPGKPLRGGAILFAGTDAPEGHGRGYLTSVGWSNELQKFIALGLYQGGLEHRGREVVCAYPLAGESVRARIVSPVFIDPEGRRLRA